MLRRPVLVWLVSLCALAGGLVFGVGAAVAEVSHSFVTSFDGGETPAGSFGKAEGVAVDAASGAVYVADAANNVIDEFKVNGAGEYKYECQITGDTVPSASECAGLTGSATPAGGFSFEEPAALAVDNSGSAGDPSAGDLYVLDRGHGVIDKFDPAGEYLGQLSEAGGSPFGELEGIAVDSGGELWVYMRGAALAGVIAGFSDAQANEFLTSRTSQAEDSSAKPGFTVDSQDNFYVVHSNFLLVAKLNSSGSLLQEEVGGSANGQYVIGIATDPSSDDLYFDNGSRIAELTSIGEPLGQFGSAQLSGGSGSIAVDPVVGTVYVTSAADETVSVFAAAPGPRVATEAAASVTATAATLNATVNPLGSDSTYQFEYGTTTGYGQTAPAAPADAGSGTSVVPVSVALSELQGGTTYHYRIVASNANGGPIHGGDRTFTTLPTPVIDGASATNLTSSSGDLTAKINPRGLDTTYRFEWGTSTAYGTSVPVPDADIGAGTGDVAVSTHLSGLDTNTTYHWRVVARNGNGTSTGGDHTFIYSTGGHGLPDNRAYEMVTPAHKNAALLGDVFNGFVPDVGEEGSRLVLSTTQCFGDATSCPVTNGDIGTSYGFTRTSGGWVAGALAPSASQFVTSSGRLVSADAGTALFAMPTQPEGEYDWYARGTGGSFRDIGPMASTPVNNEGRTEGTVDLRYVVYEDIPRWPFDATRPGGNNSLYEYVGVGNSAPVLVGVSGGRGSTDLISECGTLLGDVTNSNHGALSADGRTVFFLARACSSGSGANAGVEVPRSELFARVDESRTVPISARSPLECAGSSGCLGSPPGTAHFAGASADGSKAFFLDPQQLTDSASEDSHGSDDGEACSRTVGVNGCNLYECMSTMKDMCT